MSRLSSNSAVAFGRDERGGTAAEFGLLCVLFVGVMLGIVDGARLAWEINSAKAATRVGARYAAVSLPAADLLRTYDGVAAAGGNGLPVPEGSLAPITCTSTGCSAGSLNGAALDAMVDRMRAYYGRVTRNNVEIEFRHVGLGLAGTPCAPDVEPMITVRLKGLTFESGALRMFGIQPFAIPPVASTISAESLGQVPCA